MNIRKFVAAAAAISLLAIPSISLAQVLDKNARNTGFNITAVQGEFEGISPTSVGLISSIINIINALLVLAAIAAIVFIIIGGVRYVTSQGDEDATEQAKNSIIYAIIGIIVILLAAVIVNFFTLNLVAS